MKLSKPALLAGVLIFSVMLVYGTAVIISLFTGSFFLENGVFDPGYLLLTAAIALPVVSYILIANEKYKINMLKVLAGTLIFVSSLFILVYLTLSFGNVTSGSSAVNEEVVLTVIVLFVSLVFVVITHYEFNRR